MHHEGHSEVHSSPFQTSGVVPFHTGGKLQSSHLRGGGDGGGNGGGDGGGGDGGGGDGGGGTGGGEGGEGGEGGGTKRPMLPGKQT